MAGSSPQDTKTEEAAKADIPDKAPDAVVSAESSPAEKKVEDKGDLVSRVKDALAKKPEAENTTDSGEQGSKPDPVTDAPAKEGDAADDGSGDLTEEELARLRPKTRKRIDNLLKDRSDRDAEISTLKPDAEQFRTVKRFVEEAGLSKDEVNQGFDVMRALKRDPARAYQVLRPIMDQLEQINGLVLPDDLQQAVRLGQITEAHATELSRTRASTALSQRQLQERNESAEAQRQQDAHKSRVDETSTKVSEWERSQEKSDPDWKHKQKAVMQAVELETMRQMNAKPGWFPSPDEALKISKDALAGVNEQLKAFVPRKREINPAHADSSAASSLGPKPKTALEAARRALATAG